MFKGSGSSASEAGCADAEPLSRLAVDLPTTCAAEDQPRHLRNHDGFTGWTSPMGWIRQLRC